MVAFVCLHFALPHHHYADVCEGIELEYICQVHSVECVSKIKSFLSVIFYAIYRAVCIQLLHFSDDDCENMCTLSYYFHQIGSMIHLPLFRVRSRNYGMHCMSFYVLISILSYLTLSILSYRHDDIYEPRCIYRQFIQLPSNIQVVTQLEFGQPTWLTGRGVGFRPTKYVSQFLHRTLMFFCWSVIIICRILPVVKEHFTHWVMGDLDAI